MPLQRLIGTQAFLPALLARIRDELAPTVTAVPLDNVIFQSILLCLVAGDKHLILRTPEEDIALTVKLVVWTISSIFDMPTRKLKIRPRSVSSRPSANPPDPVAMFLHSLFLPALSSESNSNYTSPNEDEDGSPAESRKQHKPHAPKHSVSSVSIKRTHTNITATPPILRRTSPESILMQGSTYNETSSSTNTGILKPTPTYPPNYPAMAHAFTDPLPVRQTARKGRRRHHGSRSSGASKQLLQLPQALVISGLETGSDAVQRALAQVIREKQVCLDDENIRPLPEDFFVVYVCPWNARERPEIHKSLLDKFAMSTNILVSQNVRRDFNLMNLWPSGPSRVFDPSSQSNPSSPAPAYPLPLSPSQTYTPPVSNKALPTHRHDPSASTAISGPSIPTKPHNTPFPPTLLKALREVHSRVYFSSSLLVYLSDVISAARHNSRLDGTLLTATAMRDAQALIKASRVIGLDLTGAELLRPSALDPDTGSTTEESQYVHEDAVEEDDHLFQDARSTFDLPGDERQGLLHADEARTAGETTSGHHHDGHPPVKRTLNVSEVDVARIVPRVISHRLRLRDGPEDEVLSSALFGATFRPPAAMLAGDSSAQQVEHEKPLSVKNLLVQILAEV